MNILETHLNGCKIIEPCVLGDSRGFFFESWHKEKYASLMPSLNFVQDNISLSSKNVLRGLHLQHPYSQGKLVQVLLGEVYDVAVDIRLGSPTFGKWLGVILSAENHKQLWIPPGFAHGFLVLSDTALFSYKCTEFYHPECEISLYWKDPFFNITWPLTKEPILSSKDQKGIYLKDIEEPLLPQF